MADRITNIISKTANMNVSGNDYVDAIKKSLAKSVQTNLQKEIQTTKDAIEKNNKGSSENKKVNATTKKYEDELKNDVSPYIKKRAKSIISYMFHGNSDMQKARTEAFDKYVDEFVKNSCSQIDNTVQSLEEYKLVAESVIRACHDSINNDPDLKKEIDHQILSALQDAAVKETMNLMNSKQINNLVLKEDMYIKKIGNSATKIINSTKFLTNVQIDDLIRQTSHNASKNIADAIANNTFGKLAKLPIIGSCFASLQNVTKNIVQKGIDNLVKKKMKTSWAKKIKSIKAFQTRTETFQKEATAAIQKAEEEAKNYTAKLEQKAINEIKKYINLDNLSIGGFKL